MKRKGLAALLLGLMLCCLFLTAPLPSLADFGDFSGDSDYGGGFDYDFDDYDYDDDDDYGYGLGYNDFGSGSGRLNSGGLPIGLIIAVIIIYVIIKSRKKGVPNGGGQVNVPQPSHPDLLPISQYHELDANFDASALTEKLSNLYVQMQNCWQDKNMESLRPYFTDMMYAQFDRQLDALRRNKQTNYVERIAVLGVDLNGYYQAEGNDHIVATVRSRIVDYTLSDTTGQLLRGNQNQEKFMTYEWILVRPSGQTSSAGSAMQSIHCPNCGAPLDINHSAKCPYCDSIITLEQHDFVISSIRGVSQQTGR